MVRLFQLPRRGVVDDMNYPPAGLGDDAEFVTVPQRMDILAEQKGVLDTVRIRASFRPAGEEGHAIPAPPFRLGKRDDVRNLYRHGPACYPTSFVAIGHALAARRADGKSGCRPRWRERARACEVIEREDNWVGLRGGGGGWESRKK